MVHFPGSDGDNRALPRNSAKGNDQSWCGYRFGSTSHRKWGRGRAALNRINDYLRSAIEAMAETRLRRTQRELGRHGRRHAT